MQHDSRITLGARRAGVGYRGTFRVHVRGIITDAEDSEPMATLGEVAEWGRARAMTWLGDRPCRVVGRRTLGINRVYLFNQ